MPSRWKHRRRLPLVAALSTMLAIGTMNTVAPAQAAPETAGAKPTSSASSPHDPASAAVVRAQETGRSVNIAEETTQSSTVVANADGSFTRTSSSNPQRVQQDGKWVPIDTTLVKRKDGSYGPRAATTSVSFGPGGTEDLVSLDDGSHSLGFTWPSQLPEPTVSGDTATYPEVLPGVDLQLTADAAGYSSMLVVKTAAAAANPALQQVDFGLTPNGLTVVPTTDGGADAADSHTGESIFHSDTALMWDSSPATGNPGAAAPATASRTALASPQAEHAAASRIGGHHAEIKVSIQHGKQTLTPDLSLLTAKSTQYPVFIDPQWSGSPGKSQLYWARISSNGWDVYNSTSKTGSTSARIGLDNWPATGGADEKARTYYQMNTAGIKGATVSKAHLYVVERWSAQCNTDTAAAVYSVGATGGFNAAHLYWGHEPSKISLEATASGHEASCGSSSEHVTPASLDFVITNRMKAVANSKASSTNLLVEAKDMSDKWAWKQLGYGGGATLSVTYSYPPKLKDGDGDPKITPSVADQGRTLTTTPTPTLSARAVDPDLAGGNEPVTVDYHVYDSTGAVIRSGYGPNSGYTTNGGDWRITPALPKDGTYTWRVIAKNSSGLWSAWGAFHTFVLDRTQPTLPSVTSTQFPPGQIGAAFGDKGVFALGNDKTNTVTGYLFSLDGNLASAVYSSSKDIAWTSSTTVKQGTIYFAKADNADGTGTAVTNGTAGPSFAPGTVGTHTLYVKAVNQAGTTSPQTSYQFDVGSSPPVYANGDEMVTGFTATNTDQTTTVVPAGTETSAGGSLTTPAASKGTYLLHGRQGMLANISTTSKVANGDTATLSFDVPKAGSWDIGANLTTGVDYGTYTVTLDSGQANATTLLTNFDAYSSFASTQFRDFGVVKDSADSPQTLTQGVHTLTFKVTGKNTASTGYQLGLDALRLGPTLVCTINDPAKCANNTAISTYTSGTPAAVTSADADGSGYSLNAADLTAAGWTAGSTVTVDGAAIKLPSAWGAGTLDNMLGSGQLVAVPSSGVVNQGNALVFLGFATNGAVNGASGTITYADNRCSKSQDYTLDSITEWSHGTTGSAVLTLPHRNLKDGTQATAVTPSLFAFSVPLICPGTPVTSVTMPLVSNGVQAAQATAHFLGLGFRPTSMTGTGSSAVHWVGSWASAQDTRAVQMKDSAGTSVNATLNNQTVRLPAQLSLGTGTRSGSGARIHLSNQLGTAPVTFDAASIALQDKTAGGAAVAAAPLPLTFHGSRSVTLPAGTDVLSDPVTLGVVAQDVVLVSLKVHGSLSTAAGHLDNRSPVYVTAADNTDHTGDTAATSFSASTINGTPFLASVDVTTSATEPSGALLLYGDQTVNADTASRDGLSQLDNDIAASFVNDPDGSGIVPSGILNLGSSSWSNKFLLPPVANGTQPQSATGLVDRELLDQANVRAVLVSAGSNDLLACTASTDVACATAVEGKLVALATQLRNYTTDDAYNANVTQTSPTGTLAVYVATLPAFAGTHTALQESARQLVNSYILGGTGANYLNGNADGVVDFAAAVSSDGTDTSATVNADDMTAGYPNNAYYQDLAQQYLSDGPSISGGSDGDDDGSGDGSGAYDPVAWWQLNEGSGSTASDIGIGTGDLSVNHPATLNNVTWSGGRVLTEKTGTFNGTSSYANTDLGLDTTKSFSVSAWVRLTDKSADRTVFIKDATGNPSFELLYDNSLDRWEARMPTGASGDEVFWATAIGSTSPEPGLWTQLGAAYDAETGTLALYVDGVADAGYSDFTPFNDPGGATWIGRGKAGGYFAGDINSVQVWNRAVDPGEMADLADPALVADWEFDDGTGTTASDSGDYAHPGTLSGGTTWDVAGHSDTDQGALTLNGTDGSVSGGSTPLLRTDQSFSVSAWVKLTNKNDSATVAGQEGVHSSGFQLVYDKTYDCWAMELPVADAVDPDENVICQPGGVQLNTWTHLVGIYNADADMASIYVNGTLAASDWAPSPEWNSTGSTTVGRSRWDDTESTYFPGEIDAVRLYQGVLSDDDITYQAGN